MIPYVRLFGADAGTVYLQHISSGAPLICEDVDTLVLASGHRPACDLAEELAQDPNDTAWEVHAIGDCPAPRTAEEAVLEGLKIGASL